ncbi:transcription regulator Bat, regulates bacteriorhodopsin synthesis [Bacillus sp. JCM 19046]|nr:transcription regulator Bat, regulates bacteriorhodopsin synthesis [Bacillus sp. JCM 19045]GAF19898.1 transcription regulator Bat, regulates bacteriorhodopsin synthesis [Bacillus sp. JCM 19046]
MLQDVIKQAELLVKVLDYTRVGVLITDPDLEDNAIVYVSEGFSKMTGYSRDEVLGTNCRFLQGADTEKSQVDALRQAIAAKEPALVEILNYRKDGSSFWNELTIDPVYLAEQDKLYFVGVQRDITQQKEAELEYRRSVQQIKSISTPIVPLLDGLAILPLIGEINKERFNMMFETVTEEVGKTGIKKLVVDVSGITKYDSFVVAGIFQLRDVLKLIGTELVITGMAPDLAIKSVMMEADQLDSISTARSVKSILQEAYEIRAKK